MRLDNLNTDAAVAEELGRRLERARLDANLTQQQLADRAGVGKATLERLEAGKPSKLTTFIRVLRALGRVDALNDVVPERRGPTPLDVVTRGRERKRATRSRQRRPPDGARRPWGDER